MLCMVCLHALVIGRGKRACRRMKGARSTSEQEVLSCVGTDITCPAYTVFVHLYSH